MSRLATADLSLEATIARVLRRAKKGHEGAPRWLPGSSGIDYFKIGKTSATAIVRAAFGSARRPPRIGYGVDLPDTLYNGHRGHWLLSNRSGGYELQFLYRS